METFVEWRTSKEKVKSYGDALNPQDLKELIGILKRIEDGQEVLANEARQNCYYICLEMALIAGFFALLITQ